MIVWLLIGVIIVLFGVVVYQKQVLRQVTKQFPTVSANAKYGQRFSAPVRSRDALEFIEALNTWVDEIEQRIKQAEAVDDELSIAIQGLSHDLRTPLTAIKGYAELMQTSDDELKQTAYAQMILQASDRLVVMVDQLYDLTRLTNQRQTPELVVTDINEIVLEVFTTLYDQFEKQQIAVNLPETAPARVIVDTKMMKRILENLAQNILRYAASHTSVTYDLQGEMLLLTVRNDVDPQTQIAVEQVFRRFYSADKSRHNEASGIGLTISKQLIERMGGDMTATFANQQFALNVQIPVANQ